MVRLEMIGDGDASSCIDGVCSVPITPPNEVAGNPGAAAEDPGAVAGNAGAANAEAVAKSAANSAAQRHSPAYRGPGATEPLAH